MTEVPMHLLEHSFGLDFCLPNLWFLPQERVAMHAP